MAQNGKQDSLKSDFKVREIKNLFQKDIANTHSNLRRGYKIISKNLGCNIDYSDKLMVEPKSFKQNRWRKTEPNCKNLKLEEEPRSASEYNVQTLIKPQVTNPKIFWSKSEDEGFSSDSRNVKNTILEEKVITNIFKPIRSGPSSEITRAKVSKKETKKSKESTGKVEKSIHESLRIQKVKRRTRLPFSWDDESSQKSLQAVQIYDPNYYSSLMKGINQDGNDYYSLSRKIPLETSYPVKSASDEQIYEEKQRNPFGYLRMKKPGDKPERISVTEPSSPLTGHYSEDFDKKHENFDSDIDSEYTGSEIAGEIKKSKSFINKKEIEGYFSTKPRPKTSTLELHHFSQSSSSSCDSADRTRSLQNMPRIIPKAEELQKVEYYSSKNQNHSKFQLNKHWAGNSGQSENEEKSMRRVLDFGFVRREKSHTWNQNTKTDALQQINPDIFQHLIDVLLQKSRSEFPNKNQKEFFSKSLPRNVSRRVKDERPERDNLKVFKSVLEQRNSQHYKVIKKKNDADSVFLKPSNIGKSGELDLKRRPEVSKGEPRIKNGHQYFREKKPGEIKKNDKSSDAILEKGSVRERVGSNMKECVFKIEDKKLWYEICKAVERVDARERNIKKYS